jgi:hypothetical protein
VVPICGVEEWCQSVVLAQSVVMTHVFCGIKVEDCFGNVLGDVLKPDITV